MVQYSVFEGHMDELKKKVVRIQNKCKKFGCDFHFAEVGEEIKEIEDTEGNLVKCRFIIVEAEGTAIINDWEFVASVEHTESGNIFSKALTDIEIPDKYRTTKSICEHCNSNRSRKDTFIVRNTVTGEFKQVGKSCLKDFTNGMSAESAVWFASIKSIFEEAENEPVHCGYSQRYFDTNEILRFTAETIRHFGYSKSDSADSTKERMERFYNVSTGQDRWMHERVVEETKNLMKKVGFNPKSNEAIEMVENALTWLDGQEATNDYIHNLKVACSLSDTHWGRFGLLVSLFPTFNRELEYQEKKRREQNEGLQSKHVGSVGDRITVEVASVKCITSWESSFDGYHTTMTYVWKIVDVEGNVFTWKTSTWIDEENVPKTIKGTVKEHKVFRDVNQTELTRCKVLN